MVYYLLVISLNLISFFFSLLLRFTDDTFDNEQAATIGVDFKVKLINIDGNNVKLAIWVCMSIIHHNFKFAEILTCYPYHLVNSRTQLVRRDLEH